MRKILLIPLLLSNTHSVLASSLSFDENLIKFNNINTNQLQDAIYHNQLRDGVNEVDIYINDKYILSGSVLSVNGEPGFTHSDLINLGIKENTQLASEVHQGNRYFLLGKNISKVFRRSDNSLKLTVPYEALTNPDGLNKITGGTGAFINYNTYLYRSSSKYDVIQSHNTDYEAGFNMNNFIVRSHGALSSFRAGGHEYNNNTLYDGYVEREFGKLNLRVGRTMVSDAAVGVGYIDGSIISSAGGSAHAFVSFNYDAAEIVTLEFWQNDILLRKETIQRGHSELEDIPVASATSDVMVYVKRQGQIIDSRIIPRGQISTLQNGKDSYYVFSGRSVNGRRDIVSGAGYSKEFNNMLRPSVSIVQKQRYKALTVSNSTNSGKLNTGLWLTTTQNEKGKNGINVNLSAGYGNTNLSYSQGSRNFSYIEQARSGSYNTQRRSIGISQTLSLPGSLAGSIALTHYDFYNTKSTNAVSANVSLPVKSATLGAGVSYMAQSATKSLSDKLSLNLSLSIPLDFGARRVDYRSQYYKYGESSRLTNDLSVPVSDYYTLTAGNTRTMGYSRSDEYSIGNAFITPYTTANITLSQANTPGQKSRMTAGNFSGAVALNSEGIIFTPSRIRDTYAVVNTGIHQYLKVDSLYDSTLTNHDGKAIITSVAENKRDFIRVNPEGLGPGVVVKSNMKEFVAERGSVPHFKFITAKNNMLLLKWNNKPSWVRQTDVFYAESGKVIAQFIDADVLLVQEEDIDILVSQGMYSPSRINDRFKIIKNSLNKKDDIKNVNFVCNTK